MRAAWQQTTLGEVVSFKGGGTPSTEKSSYWNGDIPWVSPKDMKSSEVGDSIDKITPEAIENSAASLIPKNAVLIVVRSGILARTIPVAITTRPLAVNQDVKALCPDKDVDPRFLHYFMLASEPNILKLVTRGATVHRVSTDSLRALKFPKPPLPEQQRIVAILDDAFAGLATATANAERNFMNARELFESHLNSLFTQKNAGRTGKKLSDLVDVAHGFAFDGKYFVDGDGDYPILLTPGNFTELGCLDFNERNTKRFTGVVSPKFVLGKGELVVVMTDLSSKMKILGKPALVDRDGVLHNQRIGRVIFKDNSLWSEYLYYFFRTAHFIAGIKDTATGTMVKHTAPKRILAAIIPIPPALDEQKSIAAELNDLSGHVEKLEALYQEKLLDLAALKQVILQKAFSGELTLPPSNALKEAAE